MANIKLSKTQLSKMVQLGGFIYINVIFNITKSRYKVVFDGLNKEEEKVQDNDFVKMAKTARKCIYLAKDKLRKMSKARLKIHKGSGLTLTENEIKDIMKVMNSLESREILLKEATRKITSQKGEFLNFFRPLMTTGLSLMKNVLTPLAQSIWVPLGLMATVSATDAAIIKNIFVSETTLVFSNEEIDGIIKIVKSLEDAGLLI